jgi:hypothetical protein
MSWSDAARNFLEEHLTNLRAGLDARECDPDEVAADCRRHVEAALAGRPTVEVADVKEALARLGPVGTEPPRQSSRMRRWELVDRTAAPAARRGVWWFILTVLLPACALALGIGMEMHDLVPTWLHILLIASVPAAGLAEAIRPQARFLPALRGIACGSSLYYTTALLPLTPFAMIGIMFMGAGLLLLSPHLALVRLIPAWWADRPGRRAGALAALAAVATLAIADLRGLHTIRQLDEARDPARRAEIAAGLARFGDDELLRSVAHPFRRGMLRSGPVLMVGWSPLLGDRSRDWDGAESGSQRAVAEELLFRMSGDLDLTAGARATWWDEQLGRQVVGAPVEGLSAAESRIDGSLDGDGGLAYLEWTFVFANSATREQEARLELVLPPEGVVSRLTLWVNGEPREAAVGGRAEAVGAYRQVAVRQRRDPALVTTMGGDRVLLQAFPVPAAGRLQVRVGISAPLALSADRGEARLLLPAIAQHNLVALPAHHPVWLAGAGGVRLAGTTEALVIDLRRDVPTATATLITAARQKATAAWTPQGDGAVVQTWREAVHRPLTVVLDAGAQLAAHEAALRDGLTRELPGARLLLAQDALVPDGTRFRGGHDNSAVVAEALATDGTVVWIHGAQPIGRAGAALRAALERRPDARLIEVQIAAGPTLVLPETDGAGPVRSLRLDAAELPAALAILPGLVAAPTAERIQASAPPEAAVRTSDHLVRLLAVDRVRSLLAGPTPDRNAARALAQQHRLVTPVSGLVVLETRAQEVAMGLTPADAAAVPAVPEPETWAMLLLALLLVAVVLWRRRHLASA